MTDTRIAQTIELFDRLASRQTIGRYDIPVANLRTLEERLAELNRKAEKLGTQPITHAVLGFFTRENRNPYTGEKTPVRYARVTVEGETPVIGGWEFVAVLEHTGGRNIVRNVPNARHFVPPTRYWTAPAQCDHCGLERNRKDTYLLYRDGEWVQVGSGCLADFTGANNPHRAASVAQWLREVAREAERLENWFYGRGVHTVGTLDYLGHTCAIIRTNGWLSRGTARSEGGLATADAALENMTPTEYTEVVKVTGADRELAREVLDWVRDELEPDSEYEWNLQTACLLDWQTRRRLGLVASAVPAYQRVREAEREAEAKPEERQSDWVGEVKERRVWTLTLLSTRPIEGYYGLSVLHRFMDEAGNIFVWFATGDVASTEEGQTYRVRGTVKAHEEYNGQRQTVLTRCKFEDTVERQNDWQTWQEAVPAK